MQGSNYWGYSYKTQHSYPRFRLITWRRPEVKFGRNVVKKKHKNYQDEDKKSTINKKLILRLRSLISKWFQLKTLTLYFRKGDDLLCVRGEWRQEQTVILTQVLLSTIATLLLHLGLGCSTGGSLRAAKPSVCKLVLTLASCLRLTDGCGHPVYILS